MNKINVNLYGGKSLFSKDKEIPLEAEIVSCDMCDKCSLYKQGYCIKITSHNTGYCKFGTKERIKGYTSRANKYYDFKNKYKNDEKYKSLKAPNEINVFTVDNWYYIDLIYVTMEENKVIQKSVNTFSNDGFWIEKDKLTIDLLHKLLSFKPEAMFGGTITYYKEEIVPEFLLQLMKVDNELYNKLINKYKEYDMISNYVGKEAYINSLKEGTEITDITDKYCKFIYDGKYLTCKDYTEMCFIPFNEDTIELRIKVPDDMICKIIDNSQVDKNTEFKL